MKEKSGLRRIFLTHPCEIYFFFFAPPFFFAVFFAFFFAAMFLFCVYSSRLNERPWYAFIVACVRQVSIVENFIRKIFAHSNHYDSSYRHRSASKTTEKIELDLSGLTQ